MKSGLIFLLTITAVLLLLPGCAQVSAAIPNEEGVIEVVMTDYSFEPDAIRVRAGQTVTLLLRNEGDKMHEFMVGRDVRVEGNFTEGFAVDFFAGMMPEVTGPGMVMGLPGVEMDMGTMEMGDEDGTMPMPEPTEDTSTNMDMGNDDEPMSMEPTEDASMNMGGESGAMPTPEPTEGMSMNMDMGDNDQAMLMQEAAQAPDQNGGGDEHGAEITGGEFGAFQLPEMEAHGGFMVMIDPAVVAAGEVTAITFTVPEDKAGTWLFGCFQERGQHFDDGMRGTLIVEGS